MISTTSCPHCRSRAFVVKTNKLTQTYREVTYRCSSIECGCVFVAGIEAVRIIRPSACPDPSITLPGQALITLAG
jgi:hypothetical protein